jgi:hypothetical protein
LWQRRRRPFFLATAALFGHAAGAPNRYPAAMPPLESPLFPPPTRDTSAMESKNGDDH